MSRFHFFLIWLLMCFMALTSSRIVKRKQISMDKFESYLKEVADNFCQADHIAFDRLADTYKCQHSQEVLCHHTNMIRSLIKRNRDGIENNLRNLVHFYYKLISVHKTSCRRSSKSLKEHIGLFG